MLAEELRPQHLDPVKRAFLRHKLESDYRFFVRYFFYIVNGFQFQWSEHHDEIVEALMRVVRGEKTLLVINIPPRYGKTELVVILFVCWVFAQNGRAQFIHLSFSQALVNDNSSRIRELIKTPEFQSLWGTQFKQDTDAKGLWKTQAGGGFLAAPTKGTVTGFGAGVPVPTGKFDGAILVDDPLKPNDADSDTKREEVNRLLDNTVRSRRNHRTTPIVMVMQRLHDHDPAAYILEGEEGDHVEHLCMPALRSDGSALWPDKHSAEELRAMSADPRQKWTFTSQYQQQPVPEGGDFFVRDSARWYDELPKHLNFYGASDYAVTQDGGDWTEHGVFGIDPDDNIYIAAWWSGQTKADEWIETQLDLVDRFKPLKWGGETGPIKSAVEPWLTRRQRERRSYVALEWLNHSANNKEANARSFQALWEAGRIYLPKGEPWAASLLEQLTRFPKGRYDDKVDVCSIFARMISQIWAANRPKEQPKPKVISGEPTLRMQDFMRPTNKGPDWI